MNECLLDSFNELKKEQINWLTNRNNDELNDFSKLIEIIKEFIYKSFVYKNKTLFLQ